MHAYYSSKKYVCILQKNAMRSYVRNGGSHDPPVIVQNALVPQKKVLKKML